MLFFWFILIVNILCTAFIAYPSTSRGTPYNGGHLFGGTIGLLAIPLILVWFSGLPYTDVFQVCQEWWPVALGGIAIYAVAGAGWSVFKWWRFAVHAKRAYVDWIAKNPMPTVGQEDNTSRFYDAKREYERWVSDVPFPIVWDGVKNKPDILLATHKYLVMGWLTFWPISVVGTVADVIFYRLWENIYRTLHETYQRITNSVLSDIT